MEKMGSTRRPNRAKTGDAEVTEQSIRQMRSVVGVKLQCDLFSFFDCLMRFCGDKLPGSCANHLFSAARSEEEGQGVGQRNDEVRLLVSLDLLTSISAGAWGVCDGRRSESLFLFPFLCFSRLDRTNSGVHPVYTYQIRLFPTV